LLLTAFKAVKPKIFPQSASKIVRYHSLELPI
jgi:hypothetical protein